MENEIKELQSVIDRLLVFLNETKAHQNVLTDMVLGVYKETLPKNDYKSVYTKYLSKLESEINKSLNELDDVVYHKGFLAHRKFEVFSAISRQKKEIDNE